MAWPVGPIQHKAHNYLPVAYTALSGSVRASPWGRSFQLNSNLISHYPEIRVCGAFIIRSSCLILVDNENSCRYLCYFRVLRDSQPTIVLGFSHTNLWLPEAPLSTYTWYFHSNSFFLFCFKVVNMRFSCDFFIHV